MEEMNDRPYRMEDVEAIATAIMRRERFLDHKDDFIAYDPDFAPPFADDWQTLIELSYQQDADEYVLIDQTDLTKAVNEAIQQGRASMVDLRFFAQKAFGTKGLYKVFNFKAHDRMTRQPANYIIYLRVQHALALQFATQLSVKGMTPAQMAAIATAADQLAAAELAQELFKRERLRLTVVRKDLMARIWAPVQALHRTAEVIYANDDLLRGRFSLDKE
jgi:hypothetical protein